MKTTDTQQAQRDALAETAVQVVTAEAIHETIEALVSAGYPRDIVLQAAFGQVVAGLSNAYDFEIAKGVCARMIALIERMEAESKNGH